MSTTAPFLKRFRTYQRERFPLAALLVSLVPAILGSFAIMGAKESMVFAALSLIGAVAYLFHIRVIDEQRDFEHDNEHYQSRPIQAGVITRKELQYVDFVAIAVLLAVAGVAGIHAVVVASIMLAYAYVAGEEFFLGKRLRSHFFLYNGVNLFQMLLMQVFVYALASNALELTPLIAVHFLFTTTGTVLFEFLRKLRVPGEDGTGKDTYTWYLGFGRSLYLYALLLLLNSVLFVYVLISGGVTELYWFIGAGMLLLGSIVWTVRHYQQRSSSSERLLQGSFLVQYAILNLCIYFAIM